MDHRCCKTGAISNRSDSIHGYEILDLIHTTVPAPTAGELADAVEARYGTAARFLTCSSQQMTLKELLQFLFTRLQQEIQSRGTAPAAASA